MSYYGNTSHSGGYYGAGVSGGAAQPQDYSYSSSTNAPEPEQRNQQQSTYDSSGFGQNQQPPAFTTQQWQPHAAPQQQPAPAFPMQAQQPVSFWNPAMTTATMAAVAGGNADAALDLVSSAGKSFLQSKTASMVPGVTTSMQLLRTYFAVDNRYVVRKMKKILFPFLSRQWRRAELSQASNTQQKYANQPQALYDSTPHYSLPVQDENAPDLYIPCMSLITYVLLYALAHATAGPLDPQVIPSMGTWCLLVQTLQVLGIRLCLYLFLQQPISPQTNVATAAPPSLPLLDLFCYTGYKYLGLCVNLLVSLLLGRVLGVMGGGKAYYLAFCWTAVAASFAMLKTMANTVPNHSNAVTGSSGPKREILVLAFAASQLASMWIVSIATKLL